MSDTNSQLQNLRTSMTKIILEALCALIFLGFIIYFYPQEEVKTVSNILLFYTVMFFITLTDLSNSIYYYLKINKAVKNWKIRFGNGG